MKDGGAAFPRTGEHVGNKHFDAPGMTLRDWFAGQALAGICANQDAMSGAVAVGEKFPQVEGAAVKFLAALAYDYADAMLSTREASNV